MSVAIHKLMRMNGVSMDYVLVCINSFVWATIGDQAQEYLLCESEYV